MTEWTIRGSEGLDLLGKTDLPSGKAHAVAVIVHGFKGYMDYGMFPSLAWCAAEEGVIAHRFNLAHSGMTRDIKTFEKPELFARDTWRFQVEDVMCVVRAIRSGALAGDGVPLVLIGHSRGGATCLLTAGLHADELRELGGVVTINAPHSCCRMSHELRDRLLHDGFMESPSARTGQVLTIGAGWLRDQIDHPEDHDLLAIAGRIRARALVIHGESDHTVEPRSAVSITQALALPTEPVFVSGGDHVLNTPNPWPPSENPPPQLGETLDRLASFLREIHPLADR